MPNGNEEPRVLAAGKFLRLVKCGHWEYADRHTCAGAVAIVAVTDDRRLILVEQFRIPLSRNVVELPAGLVGDLPERSTKTWRSPRGASCSKKPDTRRAYALAVRRAVVGRPDERAGRFLLAERLVRVQAGGGDAHENIVVHEVPLDGAEWLTSALHRRSSIQKFTPVSSFAKPAPAERAQQFGASPISFALKAVSRTGG